MTSRRPSELGIMVVMIAIAMGVASAAWAQQAWAQEDGEQPALTATESEPSEAAAESSVAVVVVGGRRVPEVFLTAARRGLVEQLRPRAEGRAIRAIERSEALEAFTACEDDACFGAQLAELNAQSGVFLHIERTDRAYEATLRVRDPGSGALRAEAVTTELPRGAERLPEALSALAEALSEAVPSAPTTTATLTISVDVDGARVLVDGRDVGTSPVAPVDVAAGAHEVVVTAPGHDAVRRQTQVEPGQHARLDVTLRSLDPAVVAAASSGAGHGDEANPWRREEDSDITSEWWFWTVIGGGAALLVGLAIGIGFAISSEKDEPIMMQPEGIPLPPIEGGTR